MGTSSCFHVTEVEEIKRIIGEGLYEREIVGPDGSPVSGGGGGGKNTCVLLGDSLTRFWSDSTSAPPNVFASGASFGLWLQGFLGARLRILNNGGVSGNTTAQILARVQSSCIDYSPEWCILCAGTNDVSGGVATSVSTANLAAILSALTRVNIKVAIFTIPPFASNVSTGARRQALEGINSWIAECAKSYPGVYVVDAVAATSAGGGTAVSAYSYDTTHPSTWGALQMAVAGFEVLDPVIPKTKPAGSSNTDPRNALYNGMLVGDNATGSNGYAKDAAFAGNGPDGWYAGRTGASMVATLSKVARSDFRQSSYWRGVINTGGADGNRLQLTQTISYRLWSTGGTINPTTRIYVPATGAQYRAVFGGTGALAAGADPTAGWPIAIGQTFVDGTATLQCVEPIGPGSICVARATAKVTGVSVGAVWPRITATFSNAAASAQLILIAGQDPTGSGPTSWATYPECTLETPTFTVPAGFDLSGTTTSAGPSIVIAMELWTKGGALATVDWHSAFVGQSD